MSATTITRGALWGGAALSLLGLYAAILLSNPAVSVDLTLLLAWVAYVAVFCFLIALISLTPGTLGGWASPLGIFLLTGAASLVVPLHAISSGYVGRWMSGEHWVSDVIPKALALTALGWLCLAAAYAAVVMRAQEMKRYDKATLAPVPVSLGLGVLTMVAGLAALIALVQFAGGLTLVINNAFARREMFAGTGFLMPIVFLIPVGAAMLLTRLPASAGPIRQYICLLVAVGVVFALLVVLGGRGLAVRGALLLFCVFHLYVRRVGFATLAVSVVGAMLLVSVLGDVRQLTRSDAALSIESIVDAALQTSADDLSKDWDNLERSLVVIHGVPEQIPYQYFTTLARIPTTFIPRVWWPDKPGLTEASVYAPLFGVESAGRYGQYPAGAVGDYYLQGGLLGVLIGYAVQGLILAAMTTLLASRLHRPLWVIGIYIAVVFEAYQLRNLFIFQAGTVVLAYVAVVGLWGLGSRRRL